MTGAWLVAKRPYFVLKSTMLAIFPGVMRNFDCATPFNLKPTNDIFTIGMLEWNSISGRSSNQSSTMRDQRFGIKISAIKKVPSRPSRVFGTISWHPIEGPEKWT